MQEACLLQIKCLLLEAELQLDDFGFQLNQGPLKRVGGPRPKVMWEAPVTTLIESS